MNQELLETLQNLQVGNPFSPLELPFMMIAFFMAIVGYIMTVLSAKQDYLKPLLRVCVASIFIAAIPLWTGLMRDVCYYLPYSLLDYHTGLSDIYKRITVAANAAVDQKGLDFSIFDAIGSVLIDLVLVAVMRTIASLGSFIAIPVLFVQVGVERFCLVAMPVAVAGLTIPAIRNQCQGFIAFWVSVLLWPLFFSIVTVIAGFVFSIASGLQISWAESLSGIGFVGSFLASFTSGMILLGGITATPPLAYSICAHGGAALSAPNITQLLR